jgi:hypothetical protein
VALGDSWAICGKGGGALFRIQRVRSAPQAPHDFNTSLDSPGSALWHIGQLVNSITSDPSRYNIIVTRRIDKLNQSGFEMSTAKAGQFIHHLNPTARDAEKIDEPEALLDSIPDPF